VGELSTYTTDAGRESDAYYTP